MNKKYSSDNLPSDIKSNIQNDDQNSKKPKSPSLTDQEWQEGVESDDDVDELGKSVGVTYEDTEEIDITKKVPVTTESEPPSDDVDTQK